MAALAVLKEVEDPVRASPQQLLSTIPRGGPLYLQIYQRIRSLILSGAWTVGAQLPSSRTLARDLGVSRNTAILALEKLVADGWVVSRPGSGMYVSSEAPPARPHLELPESKAVIASVPVPFEISQPATDQFPVDTWSKIQRKVWTKEKDHALHEGAVAGWPGLRLAVASYLNALRGVACSPHQIFILSGTQSALDLCVRVLARQSEEIWVENPGYPYAREVFQSHALRQVPVAVDSAGICVEEGVEKASSAKLAYITPACQFPTCVVLTPARREAILEWADEQQSFILEDDWDFHAVFDGAFPVEPLAAIGSERVLYIHSFNRLLFPGLRIAALVVPQPLVSAFADARYAIERFPNVSNQIALSHFIEEGHLTSHLRRCRDVYLERQTAMHQAIRNHFHGTVHVRSDQPGLHCLAWTRAGRDSDIAAAARRAGIACLALNDFVVDNNEVPGALILGFAAFPPTVIEEKMRKLADVARREVSRSPNAVGPQAPAPSLVQLSNTGPAPSV